MQKFRFICFVGIIFFNFINACNNIPQKITLTDESNNYKYQKYLNQILVLLKTYENKLDNDYFITKDGTPNPYFKTKFLIKALRNYQANQSHIYFGIGISPFAGLINVAAMLAQIIEDLMRDISKCDHHLGYLFDDQFNETNKSLCETNSKAMTNRWIQNINQWIQNVQSNQGPHFNFIADLNQLLEEHSFITIDEYYRDWIDSISGLANRGCPELVCSNTGPVDRPDVRRTNTKEIAELLLGRKIDYVYDIEF